MVKIILSCVGIIAVAIMALIGLWVWAVDKECDRIEELDI